MMNDRLAWLDLEMTGLEPERHVIVEIAALITDADLKPLDDGINIVIHADEEQLAEMDEVVTRMHTRSGLLDAIRLSTVDVPTAQAEVLEYVKSHVPYQRSVPLCGSSIGTDRRFLAKYMPDLEDYLHYRSVDVSSIKELARRWYPATFANRPQKETAHRALDDVHESAHELRFYRDTLFVKEDPAAAVKIDHGGAAETGSTDS